MYFASVWVRMGHLLSKWMLRNQSAGAFLILCILNKWPTGRMCETATAENFPATSNGAQQCEVKTILFFDYFWVVVVVDGAVDKCKLNFCCLFEAVDDEFALLVHTSTKTIVTIGACRMPWTVRKLYLFCFFLLLFRFGVGVGVGASCVSMPLHDSSFPHYWTRKIVLTLWSRARKMIK